MVIVKQDRHLNVKKPEADGKRRSVVCGFALEKPVRNVHAIVHDVAARTLTLRLRGESCA